jgi:16S rRNA G966 N2-methylase RsmD
MDTRQFIEEHLNDDVHELALKHSNAKVDMALALRQIEARQLLRKKVPSWSANPELLFPSHLSIEQCSSEASANYKASLMKGESFADLTGGLGIDCYYISQNFQHSDYVEHNPELCALARHNYEVLGAKTMVVHNDSAEVFLNQCEPLDCLFIDPARRDVHGRKVVSVSDCTPNVVDLQDLMLRKAKRVMVKLSPMLDISQALKELRHVKEIHVVAVSNECKELLFIMERAFDDEPTYTCVNLETRQPAVTFSMEEERVAILQLAKELGHYLYEPNPAVMKGGCYKMLSQRYALKKLHRNSHLYTSDSLIQDFPGRIFEVDGWAIYGKKAKDLLKDVDKASIAVRNFPMTVAEIRKSLKINDGDQTYLFATTLSDERKVIILTHKD